MGLEGKPINGFSWSWQAERERERERERESREVGLRAKAALSNTACCFREHMGRVLFDYKDIPYISSNQNNAKNLSLLCQILEGSCCTL